MKQTSPLLLIAATIFTGTVLTAQTVTLESAPPVVVKTEPAAGSTDVEPALREIRVTFSKPMQDRSWSWCKSDQGVFPEMTGEARYLSDQRTCVLPVKLEPNTFYSIWLNTRDFTGFKDTGNRPAVPYLLTFSTAKPGKPRDVSKAVKSAVTTISQCTESDPRVAPAIASLQSLDQEQVIAELSKYLDAEQATMRRSAVYILWNGKFNDIQQAAPSLQKLLTHKEDLTRGMAALALGQNKVRDSFEPIAAVLKNDKSGYARRCAAYALGLLGDERARPVLQSALKDPEAMVRNNATAALSMLGSKTEASTPSTPEPRASAEKVIVEDLALRFLAAVRDKEDDVLKELSVDRIKGWRDTLPQFAFELRERFQQLTGKPLSLRVEESLVEGDYAAVKCTGPKELEGKHLVLFFVKTEQGWRNSLLRNSLPNVTLREHLTRGIAEMEKAKAAAAPRQEGDAASTGKSSSRAIALFNDIEDFGHEFDAAFSSKNLPAAKTGVRRLTTLITDFNAEMDDPANQFPPAILDDLGKIAAALEAGDWEKARALARHNQQFAERFQLIARHIASLALPQKLNADQRAVLDWTDRQFRSYFDERSFATLSEPERAELEARLLDQLKGPVNREYYTAINSLAALRSQKALEPLRALAFDRADKNNRDRWMAVRALGILGDKASVPELIHLVYHGNVNTRWWAQITLVRLTGQNFGTDWKAWGEWWNNQNGQPRYRPEIIRWWTGQPEPDKLAQTLEESDKKFLEQLRSAQ